MGNSMSHNRRKIQEYFARKKMMTTPYPVHSPYFSPCDFRFFGYAKKQLKDQLITEESDLEDELRDIGEHVGRNVL
jgi:hypothetical protein